MLLFSIVLAVIAISLAVVPIATMLHKGRHEDAHQRHALRRWASAEAHRMASR